MNTELGQHSQHFPLSKHEHHSCEVKLKLLPYMIGIAVNVTLCTNLTRHQLSKLLAKIIQAVQTFSATIGYSYYADSP